MNEATFLSTLPSPDGVSSRPVGLTVVGVVTKNGDTVVVGVVASNGVNCASFNKKFRFSDDSDETVNEIKYKHV